MGRGLVRVRPPACPECPPPTLPPRRAPPAVPTPKTTPQPGRRLSASRTYTHKEKRRGLTWAKKPNSLTAAISVAAPAGSSGPRVRSPAVQQGAPAKEKERDTERVRTARSWPGGRRERRGPGLRSRHLPARSAKTRLDHPAHRGPSPSRLPPRARPRSQSCGRERNTLAVPPTAPTASVLVRMLGMVAAPTAAPAKHLH